MKTIPIYNICGLFHELLLFSSLKRQQPESEKELTLQSDWFKGAPSLPFPPAQLCLLVVGTGNHARGLPALRQSHCSWTHSPTCDKRLFLLWSTPATAHVHGGSQEPTDKLHGRHRREHLS